ncbi:apolipoprotein N-acyltransferase [Candidatus Profftia sp. (ex Adelges kitamiensis)]|uniref:apolipoprotein N-acyltransferase n=1 Tax=Candidatus Profftia sp. (ex Adelges kitamiensis) TaxID=2864218 RepID=UPI001CE25D0B|nr:apolipoprotein N-acyltransferase [Candidatus Profftia sp. (ex Adelges kitamiensis)]
MSLFFSYNWLSALLAFILGATGTLSFSPYDCWPTALISMIGLLAVPLNCKTKKTIILGFLWGMGLFGTGVSWIYISIKQFGGMSTPINILLITLLITYLSFYPMLFTGLLNYFWPTVNFWRLVVAAPTLWQITELLRSYILTGFPWLQFGYSQINGPLKGLIPIFGVNIITYLLMTISGLLVLSISSRTVTPSILAIILLILPYPLCSIQFYQSQPCRVVRVAMVQGNIKQTIKWNPNLFIDTLKTYLAESYPYLYKAQIIIWPELTITDTEKHQNQSLIMLDRLFYLHHSSLVTGIINDNICENSQYNICYYNSIIVLGDQKPYKYAGSNRYNKHHLVPFGEFVPIERFLRPLAPLFNLPMSSFTKGNYIQPPLSVQGYKITSMICYEILLGEQIRANFSPDTNFLLTISNDAWFGHSIGPWQHFQMARIRALELGRPLLCSTNNGITAAVDASGNVIAKIPQFKRKVLEVMIMPTIGITPYARFGSIPLWIIIFTMSYLSIYFRNIPLK